MRKLYMAIAIAAISAPVLQAQEDFDDIYYNPKKGSNQSVKKSKKQSYYIKDFSDMDVDDYNRRGFYYNSPVDTIGMSAEAEPDFVYTQQIQKYYNPTIVLDNSDMLADVLENSYGNVDIIINDFGIPSFAPLYMNPWWSRVSWNWGWGPSWSWNWGPSWSWNWGPSWAWNPSWNWGWGPSWTWGPGWGCGGPGWGGPNWGWNRPHYSDHRPGSHRPVTPRPGWSHNTRPGYNSGVGNSRPVGNRPVYGRPGNSASGSGIGSSTSRPNRNVVGNSPARELRLFFRQIQARLPWVQALIFCRSPRPSGPGRP